VTDQPLDLRALEAALAESGSVRDGRSRAWIVQLLAALRAHRAALQPFADWAAEHTGDEEDDHRSVNLAMHGVGDTWYSTQRGALTRGYLRRAASVLATVRDEP
jgi:hypothetical protein